MRQGMSMERNLDARCAQLGELLGMEADKDRANLLDDGLGVLQEQGLYAFFLFLKTRSKGNPDDVRRQCEKFLRSMLPPKNNVKIGELWKYLRNLAGDLDNLLFAREMLIQALTYARYHARVRTDGRGQA